MQQLELPLWETLLAAASVPEDADLQELWFSVDATIAPLETQQQLQVVADAVIQIVQIVQQRSLLTLEEIDSMMQEAGPVVSADFFDKFLRQSMHVDLDQFMESPLPRRVSKRSRQYFPNDGRSVVGVVDKAALLAAVEREPQLSDEAALADALAVAHFENISTWQSAIALWMQQSVSKSVSLLQLQQALKMPMIEIWLSLLLGEQEQYQWETSGEFYNEAGETWLRLELVKEKHHASSRSKIGK